MLNNQLAEPEKDFPQLDTIQFRDLYFTTLSSQINNYLLKIQNFLVTGDKQHFEETQAILKDTHICNNYLLISGTNPNCVVSCVAIRKMLADFNKNTRQLTPSVNKNLVIQIADDLKLNISHGGVQNQDFQDYFQEKSELSYTFNNQITMNYFLKNYALESDFVFIRTCKMVNKIDNDLENNLLKDIFDQKENCLLQLDFFKKLQFQFITLCSNFKGQDLENFIIVQFFKSQLWEEILMSLQFGQESHMHLRMRLNKVFKGSDRDKQIFISKEERVNCSLSSDQSCKDFFKSIINYVQYYSSDLKIQNEQQQKQLLEQSQQTEKNQQLKLDIFVKNQIQNLKKIQKIDTINIEGQNVSKTVFLQYVEKLSGEAQLPDTNSTDSKDGQSDESQLQQDYGEVTNSTPIIQTQQSNIQSETRYQEDDEKKKLQEIQQHTLKLDTQDFRSIQSCKYSQSISDKQDEQKIQFQEISTIFQKKNKKKCKSQNNSICDSENTIVDQAFKDHMKQGQLLNNSLDSMIIKNDTQRQLSQQAKKYEYDRKGVQTQKRYQIQKELTSRFVESILIPSMLFITTLNLDDKAELDCEVQEDTVFYNQKTYKPFLYQNEKINKLQFAKFLDALMKMSQKFVGLSKHILEGQEVKVCQDFLYVMLDIIDNGGYIGLESIRDIIEAKHLNYIKSQIVKEYKDYLHDFGYKTKELTIEVIDVQHFKVSNEQNREKLLKKLQDVQTRKLNKGLQAEYVMECKGEYFISQLNAQKQIVKKDKISKESFEAFQKKEIKCVKSQYRIFRRIIDNEQPQKTFKQNNKNQNINNIVQKNVQNNQQTQETTKIESRQQKNEQKKQQQPKKIYVQKSQNQKKQINESLLKKKKSQTDFQNNNDKLHITKGSIQINIQPEEQFQQECKLMSEEIFKSQPCITQIKRLQSLNENIETKTLAQTISKAQIAYDKGEFKLNSLAILTDKAKQTLSEIDVKINTDDRRVSCGHPILGQIRDACLCSMMNMILNSMQQKLKSNTLTLLIDVGAKLSITNQMRKVYCQQKVVSLIPEICDYDAFKNEGFKDYIIEDNLIHEFVMFMLDNTRDLIAIKIKLGEFFILIKQVQLYIEQLYQRMGFQNIRIHDKYNHILLADTTYKIVCLINDVHHYIRQIIPCEAYFSGLYININCGQGRITKNMSYRFKLTHVDSIKCKNTNCNLKCSDDSEYCCYGCQENNICTPDCTVTQHIDGGYCVQKFFQEVDGGGGLYEQTAYTSKIKFIKEINLGLIKQFVAVQPESSDYKLSFNEDQIPYCLNEKEDYISKLLDYTSFNTSKQEMHARFRENYNNVNNKIDPLLILLFTLYTKDTAEVQRKFMTFDGCFNSDFNFNLQLQLSDQFVFLKRSLRLIEFMIKSKRIHKSQKEFLLNENIVSSPIWFFSCDNQISIQPQQQTRKDIQNGFISVPQYGQEGILVTCNDRFFSTGENHTYFCCKGQNQMKTVEQLQKQSYQCKGSEQKKNKNQNEFQTQIDNINYFQNDESIFDKESYQNYLNKLCQNIEQNRVKVNENNLIMDVKIEDIYDQFRYFENKSGNVQNSNIKNLIINEDVIYNPSAKDIFMVQTSGNVLGTQTITFDTTSKINTLQGVVRTFLSKCRMQEKAINQNINELQMGIIKQIEAQNKKIQEIYQTYNHNRISNFHIEDLDCSEEDQIELKDLKSNINDDLEQLSQGSKIKLQELTFTKHAECVHKQLKQMVDQQKDEHIITYQEFVAIKNYNKNKKLRYLRSIYKLKEYINGNLTSEQKKKYYKTDDDDKIDKLLSSKKLKALCKQEQHPIPEQDLIRNKDKIFRLKNTFKGKAPRSRAFYMCEDMHLFFAYLCHTLIPHIKKFTSSMVHGVNSKQLSKQIQRSVQNLLQNTGKNTRDITSLCMDGGSWEATQHKSLKQIVMKGIWNSCENSIKKVIEKFLNNTNPIKNQKLFDIATKYVTGIYTQIEVKSINQGLGKTVLKFVSSASTTSGECTTTVGNNWAMILFQTFFAEQAGLGKPCFNEYIKRELKQQDIEQINYLKNYITQIEEIYCKNSFKVINAEQLSMISKLQQDQQFKQFQNKYQVYNTRIDDVIRQYLFDQMWQQVEMPGNKYLLFVCGDDTFYILNRQDIPALVNVINYYTHNKKPNQPKYKGLGLLFEDFYIGENWSDIDFCSKLIFATNPYNINNCGLVIMRDFVKFLTTKQNFSKMNAIVDDCSKHLQAICSAVLCEQRPQFIDNMCKNLLKMTGQNALTYDKVNYLIDQKQVRQIKLVGEVLNDEQELQTLQLIQKKKNMNRDTLCLLLYSLDQTDAFQDIIYQKCYGANQIQVDALALCAKKKNKNIKNSRTKSFKNKTNKISKRWNQWIDRKLYKSYLRNQVNNQRKNCKFRKHKTWLRIRQLHHEKLLSSRNRVTSIENFQCKKWTIDQQKFVKNSNLKKKIENGKMQSEFTEKVNKDLNGKKCNKHLMLQKMQLNLIKDMVFRKLKSTLKLTFHGTNYKKQSSSQKLQWLMLSYKIRQKTKLMGQQIHQKMLSIVYRIKKAVKNQQKLLRILLIRQTLQGNQYYQMIGTISKKERYQWQKNQDQWQQDTQLKDIYQTFKQEQIQVVGQEIIVVILDKQVNKQLFKVEMILIEQIDLYPECQIEQTVVLRNILALLFVQKDSLLGDLKIIQQKLLSQVQHKNYKQRQMIEEMEYYIQILVRRLQVEQIIIQLMVFILDLILFGQLVQLNVVQIYILCQNQVIGMILIKVEQQKTIQLQQNLVFIQDHQLNMQTQQLDLKLQVLQQITHQQVQTAKIQVQQYLVITHIQVQEIQEMVHHQCLTVHHSVPTLSHRVSIVKWEMRRHLIDTVTYLTRRTIQTFSILSQARESQTKSTA